MRKTPPGYINKPAAAKLLNCTLRSIDNWTRLGIISHYKFGSAVLFKESDLMQDVEASKVARKAEADICNIKASR